MASVSRVHEVEVRLYLEENWPYESSDDQNEDEPCTNQDSSFDLIDRIQNFYRSNRDMKSPDAHAPIIVVDRLGRMQHRSSHRTLENCCMRISKRNQCHSGYKNYYFLKL